MLSTSTTVGCTADNESGEGQEGDNEVTATGAVSQGGGSGEHGSSGEGSGGEEAEGSEGSGGGEEASGATLAPNETFDKVHSGARLVMNYDAASNSVLTRVRIEVHVSNGKELGPTIPINMAPGEMRTISLPSMQASFAGWIAHDEVGSGEGSGEVSGESSAEAGEAAMSSPVISLGQSWEGGIVSMAEPTS